jgi:cell division protein FtsA
LELVNTELKAYGAYEQKKKLIAGIVLTGGGSNLKHIRQFTNYITGFDSRLGFANEYISNDKNQHLKGPEFATAIGLLMESLKIRDKKSSSKSQPTSGSIISETIENANANHGNETLTIKEVVREKSEEIKTENQEQTKKSTIGEIILKKVKDFFEAVED